MNLIHTGAVKKYIAWKDEDEEMMDDMISHLHKKYSIDVIAMMTGVKKEKLLQETYTFTQEQFRNTLDFYLKSKHEVI